MTEQDELVADGWSVNDVVRRVVAGHPLLVAACAVLGLVIATFYAQQATPSYRASTELVTGTYSVPPDIGLQEALDGAGPLGLELPAETQARIIASPAVVSLAVTQLGLDQAAGRNLLISASASANTDNVFTVSASGPTPRIAAAHANAIADAYLTYRQDRAAEKLEPLRVEAVGNADRADELADELQDRIENARDDGNTGLETALTTQQQEYERSAEVERNREAVITATLESFNGGGTVVRPADADTASGGTSLARLAAVGLLAGLLLGFAVALLVERLRSPARTVDDVVAATGVSLVLEPGRREGGAIVAGRRLWRTRTPDADSSPWSVALVPTRTGSDVERTRAWLEDGFTALEQRPVSVDPGGSESDDAPASFDTGGVSLTTFPDVPTLCLDPGSVANERSDVIVTVTRGHDTVHALRTTVEDLRGAGLSVIAVALVAPSRRRRASRSPARSTRAAMTSGDIHDGHDASGRSHGNHVWLFDDEGPTARTPDGPVREDEPGPLAEETLPAPGPEDDERGALPDGPAATETDEGDTARPVSAGSPAVEADPESDTADLVEHPAGDGPAQEAPAGAEDGDAVDAHEPPDSPRPKATVGTTGEPSHGAPKS